MTSRLRGETTKRLKPRQRANLHPIEFVTLPDQQGQDALATAGETPALPLSEARANCPVYNPLKLKADG